MVVADGTNGQEKKAGLQRVRAATMIMMAAGTFASGLIPSYASIGIMAPMRLLVARLVQGFSTGGEYRGTAPAAGIARRCVSAWRAVVRRTSRAAHA
ncbi:hypothetical protein BFF94_015570 [Burkholderia catarinensis]|nr:hypothetical protein BFF94_015570 [Burkholderia catarinensis]